ncbi:uncharacterized protein LOC128904316 isoform X1 [Rissa tridactyla]|uniref:uncharacterized protein LOC128904316 isoform X1 n=1 Tax=Rissa tridactyla TaxID=75485 RepID=UPI0023BB013D|nr:uncharacterized protein LOC128904316 isoform X1 [Rissa tridactyla]XP_054044412.1 uncharacterized protein LOC128904316 isoform X1 [Rissa tridactyla]XP_054044413.1 uncharacterized protein LOC128904316 isoform X1 [Rissa tridactyla]
MVATRSKAAVKKTVGTQTEAPHEHMGVQASGCRVCRSLAVATEGSGDNTCVRCEQVNDLLVLVAELKAEVERLRSIRECERESDWWTHSLREREQVEAPHKSGDPLPSRHQAVGGDCREEGEWKQVPARGSRRIPSWALTPSQLPLQNRYGVLQEELAVGEEDDTPRSGTSERPSRHGPSITTGSKRKSRRVTVVGDSLLRGAEGPICHPDPLHREVCCLPGARVRDVLDKLPGLANSSDYYPLLVFQVGSDEVGRRSPKSIKRDFRALGRQLKGSGTQVVFSSIPSVAILNEEINRKRHQVNWWLWDWWYRQGFGFFDHRLLYESPDLLVAGGTHLSQKGKRILGQELARLIDRALN